MQALLVRILVAAWPKIEPVVIGALRELAIQAIHGAKSQTLPARYSFLQPVLVELEDDVIKFLDGLGR